MKQLINPQRTSWKSLCKRPEFENEQLDSEVSKILKDVKENGNNALFDYTFQLDGVKPESLEVSPEEINSAETRISSKLKEAIKLAAGNIRKFHLAQQYQEPEIEIMQGVKCRRKSVPIEKVGFYIPGGSAPLFSTLLMLGIPAKIAGCNEIVICTPPNKNGEIHPAILYTAGYLGINRIYKVGGAQAIAAMALGTESILQVYKIFGPGNQYVTRAKELVQLMGTAIDMPAGPSEVMVIADKNANPSFVAADLLSQAEHGPDSQVVLLSDSKKTIERVQSEIIRQTQSLSRNIEIENTLKNSFAIKFDTIDQCFDFSNEYAPEHLIINIENPEEKIVKIINAGSVFIGPYSCESAGDYASGTNHVLPTKGFAKSHSGVSLDHFLKKITFQKISREGILGLGSTIEIMADAEGLEAHKNAVSIRLKQIKS